MTDTTAAPRDDSSETPQVATAIANAYHQLTNSQEQKLVIARYIDEKAAEINDPAAATKAMLLPRYSHFTNEMLDDAVAIIGETLAFEHESDSGGSGMGISGDIHEAGDRLSKLLGDEYGRLFLVAHLQHVLDGRRTDRTPGGKVDDLRGSVFTGLIADFELFIVNLLGALYSNDARKLFSKERTVPLSALFGKDSLEELRERLIDEAVVDIMRGPLADWLSALKRDHNVVAEKYAINHAVSELFQRRHVIVHNGGRASRLYLEKVKSTAEIGDPLPVTADYLRSSADSLIAIALGLTVCALLECQGVSSERVEGQMADWSYRLLLAQRYSAVDNYLSEVPMDRLKNEDSAHTCNVNRWLALKRLGRFAECRDDVEAWRVGHLGSRYKLAKLALLDETAEAAALCRQMRGIDELPLHHWVEWPLLREVREYEIRDSNSDAKDAAPDDTPVLRSEVSTEDLDRASGDGSQDEPGGESR